MFNQHLLQQHLQNHWTIAYWRKFENTRLSLCHVTLQLMFLTHFIGGNSTNNLILYCLIAQEEGILNRQSRAERQNTFDWLHILPVRVTISQYKSYSANGSHILPVEVIFYQQEWQSVSINHALSFPIMHITQQWASSFCQWKWYSANRS